jgi:hypothetical protein
VIGLATDQKNETRQDGKWFKAIPPSRLQPKDLHQAQLQRRLAEDK